MIFIAVSLVVTSDHEALYSLLIMEICAAGGDGQIGGWRSIIVYVLPFQVLELLRQNHLESPKVQSATWAWSNPSLDLC